MGSPDAGVLLETNADIGGWDAVRRSVLGKRVAGVEVGGADSATSGEAA